MEEISKPQIARLVLGYLKKGNFKIAYNCFYKQCSYFEKYRQKKFKVSTRYNGLTLEDILQQYSEIYSIVQPRLEDTDYFDDRSFHKEELPQQLLYLLDQTRSRSETTSSPASPASIYGTNEYDANAYMTSLEASANLDVSTTPLQTLPGNSVETLPKFSKPLLHIDTETERDESSSGEGEKAAIGDVVEVFKETLLAHEELQQKIAHTINEVRNSGGEDMQQQSFACEVESVIKAIVSRTETDPTFESLVAEILGPVPHQQVQQVQQENHNQHKADAKHLNHENVIVIDSNGDVNSQQVMMHSKNLLMLKPQTSTPGYMDTPPGINLSPQGPEQYNLTEQDIMSMPVYVCDDKHEEKVMVEQGVQVPEKRLKTLMPVRRPAKTANTLVDYITMYKSDANEDEGPTSSTEVPNLPSTSYATIQVLPLEETIPEVRMDVKTPEAASAPANKAPAPTPRSGNRSHIRALDFKFSTPAKDVLNVTHSSSTSPKMYVNKHKTPHVQKSSKSLFNVPATTTSASKIKEPWDMKFRNCLPISKPTPSEKRIATKAEKKVVTKSPNENVDSSNRTAAAKSSKPTKKKASGKRAKPKPSATTSPSNANQAAKTNETTPISNKTLKGKILKEVEFKEGDVLPQNCIKLININRKPVFHRKCNIENKREVKVAIPKEPKLIELMTDSDKLVLSPSKLNGSKRSLVEMEIMPEITSEVALVGKKVDRVEPMTVPSSSAMRNLIPLLETPGKDFCPATPGVYSPSTAEDTPLTKVFKEQMVGVDISSIPTPNVLLTPSFPFTPFMEGNQSPLNNRPTDYSTSSSYYQPSENEKDKSLDKLVKECQRLEKEQEMAKDDGPEEEQQRSNNALPIETGRQPEVCPAVVQQIKTLGSNVIARKNLNLIKGEGNDKKDDMNMSTASTCDSSSSSSSSSNSSRSSRSGSDFGVDHDLNETVVEQSSSRYSLRSRSSSTPNEKFETFGVDKDNANMETCKVVMENKQHINDIVNNVDFVPELKRLAHIDDKTKPRILSDLELKKQRVLEGLKNDSAEKSTKRSSTRPPPKKRKPARGSGRVLRSTTVKLKEEDLFLTSSDEDNDVRPFEIVETELLCSKSNTPISEATFKDVDVDFNVHVESEAKICVANTPEHDNIIVGLCDEVVVTTVSKDSKKKGAKSTRKPSEKPTKSPKKPTPKKTTKSASSKSTKSKSNTRTKNNAAEKTKDVAQKENNTVVIEPTPVPEMTAVAPETPESASKRELKGTTGPEAKKLLAGLSEWGIKLIEKSNPSRVADEKRASMVDNNNDHSLQTPNQTPAHAHQTHEPIIFYQTQEKIGKCITTINTPEEDLIYYDIKVFTEPLLLDGNAVKQTTRTRDNDDDHLRLTKSYGMTVYDDTTDAEIEKVMHVTPFECVFDYIMPASVKPKQKVTVLNNVLIKKDTPLKMMYDSLISDERCAKREIQDSRNSPLDSLYENKSNSSRFMKTSTRRISVDCKDKAKSIKSEAESHGLSNNDKKRKAESTSTDADVQADAEADEETNKKIKLDDQRLLKEVDVDDLLAQFYG